jgi:hypothetical protein
VSHIRNGLALPIVTDTPEDEELERLVAEVARIPARPVPAPAAEPVPAPVPEPPPPASDGKEAPTGDPE